MGGRISHCRHKAGATCPCERNAPIVDRFQAIIRAVNENSYFNFSSTYLRVGTPKLGARDVKEVLATASRLEGRMFAFLINKVKYLATHHSTSHVLPKPSECVQHYDFSTTRKPVSLFSPEKTAHSATRQSPWSRVCKVRGPLISTKWISWLLITNSGSSTSLIYLW